MAGRRNWPPARTGSQPLERLLRRSATTATSGPPTSTLAIQHRLYETGLHFIVSGKLDDMTARELKRCYERVDPREAETVLLDLADLTIMDGSGLDVLLAAHAHFGERLVIIIGPPCARTIELGNVRDVLPIIEG